MAESKTNNIGTENWWVQVTKIVLLSMAAFGYTFPLVTGMGHMVVVLAVVVASFMAWLCLRLRLRLAWCLALSILFVGIGLGGSFMTLNVFGMSSVAATIVSSRFWYYTGVVFGIVFMTRTLSLRYRSAQVIESCLALGSVVFLLFEHRDFNLTSPRELSDYLYSNGYDPIEVYRMTGLGVAFISLPLLFGRVRFGRAVYSLGFIALLAMLFAFMGIDGHLPTNIEDPLGLAGDDDENSGGGDGDQDQDKDDENDGDGGGQSDNDDQNDNGGGGGSDNNESNDDNKDDNSSGSGGGGNGESNSNQGPTGNERPTPVALAVFYDEFEPGDGIFHFRQSVLSRYDGNHLVGSEMDTDVISTMPLTNAIDAEHVQNEAAHTKISTSMFLMQEHAQPPQVAMGQHVFPIQNPDPKLYVAAYGVESLGLTLDITRLIGRRSIPKDWTKEKVNHYLKIPDDPRYRALSDIIVRKIDPRFVGDDIVKALYIKSWLEKNGYYTLKTKHIDSTDPTASFLFGSLRGYCVHFAHSAVYLLRSQGIAARVALGYAVDNRMRGTNSAVLILGNQAHAWPEIYVDGVGWVTLEVFPENGDEPPREFVDQDLESLFGELARDDKSGGKAPDAISSTFAMPWRTIWISLACLLGLLLVLAYVRKFVIIYFGRTCKTQKDVYKSVRGVIFLWVMYGHPWKKYVTLEEFCKNETGEDSATARIVNLGSAAKLGASITQEQLDEIARCYKQALKDASSKTSIRRKILGWINPWVMYR